MSKSSKGGRDRPRRPKDWSPAEKLAAVKNSHGLGEEELGRFLREHGLHEEHLRDWQQQCEQGLAPAVSLQLERTLKKEVRRLNKELDRKDRALAETAALLVLSKKARALWGGEGENT